MAHLISSKHSRYGFTLLEVVIYVAILAMVAVSVINTILMMSSALDDFRASRSINASMDVAMERMVREIRSATSTDVVLSSFGAHPGRLFLRKINPDTGAAETVDFYLNGNALVYKENGGAEQKLVASDIEIVNLVFRRIVNSAASQAIKIELTVRSEYNPAVAKNFYSTVILRGGY